eukprot:95773_1
MHSPPMISKSMPSVAKCAACLAPVVIATPRRGRTSAGQHHAPIRAGIENATVHKATAIDFRSFLLAACSCALDDMEEVSVLTINASSWSLMTVTPECRNAMDSLMLG